MDEALKTRRSTVDSILGRSARRTEPVESAEPREAFTEARPWSREDLMLDVRFSNGARCAFSYAYLLKVEFEPGDEVALHFGTDLVRIQGRRLSSIYEALLEHRARFLQQGNAAEDRLKTEEEPHIDGIAVERKDT